MKKIKMTIAAAMFCTAAFAGYSAYDRATMTDEEKFMRTNLEALTRSEDTDNKYMIVNKDTVEIIDDDGNKKKVIILDCKEPNAWGIVCE